MRRWERTTSGGMISQSDKKGNETMVQKSMKGKCVGPDEGKLYKRANDIFVKVTAEDTGGVYEVCEERCPSGFSSRKHRHTQNHETFYVLEGSAAFVLGDDTFEGTQGSLFHLPSGVPHQVIAGARRHPPAPDLPPGQNRGHVQRYDGFVAGTAG